MFHSYHPLHSGIVRIRDKTGAIVGAGFLAAPELICTCAHVVADALDIPRETEQPPQQEVHLDFLFLGEAEGTACVQVWIPMKPHDSGGDIAILRLTTDPPSAANPVCLLPVGNLSGRNCTAYGFPLGADFGQYSDDLLLLSRIANGYVQLRSETTLGYRVRQGYSGTPVWDPHGRGVVGMVVAEDRTPEAKVAFLIPNDLIFQACPDIKPITFHQLFAPLTDGLIGLPSSPLSGVEMFLREYLGTPDMPAPFGGRQAQLAELDRWLATPEHPYALLVAEAGRGKSALLARWVVRVIDKRLANVIFVPISIRFGTSLKRTTLSILGARLRHMHSVGTDLPRDSEGWLAEIETYLREDRPIGFPLLIVLDGIDEAADWMVGRDLLFPPEPGRGIKVLASGRSLADCDTMGWLRRLEWQGIGVPIKLPLLDCSGVTEVLQSMGNPLRGLAPQVDVVSELYRLSEGDPLLVRLYIEALRQTGNRAAFLKPDELKNLKPGLAAYLDQWWKDQEWQWEIQGREKGREREDLIDFFRLCAIALGPLSRDEVAAIANGRLQSGSRLRAAANEAGRFIIGDGHTQGYAFSHPRLNSYFREEQMTEMERSEWVQRFLNFGQNTLAALNNEKLDPRQASSYAVRYYGVHLEHARAAPDSFHELISENWMHAWEALEGTYDGFLSDLRRAWERADASGEQAQSLQERSRAIDQQCHYALIVTSIKSLAENIPPNLLAALVNKGVWTFTQGLAYAQQIPDKWHRAMALVALAPRLSKPLHQEVLEVTRAIADEHYRTQVLTALAPYLPESLLYEALEITRTITNEYYRARTLAALAPYLPESLQTTMLLEAMKVARGITDIAHKSLRIQVLETLAPHLPESLLHDALEITRTITDEDLRAQVLATLAPHLPESLLHDALEITRTITYFREFQAEILVKLAPHLPEFMLHEALEVTQTIADEYHRVRVLAALASHLSESMLHEALEAARAIAYEYHRAKMLAALAPHLPESLQTTTLLEALEAARAIAYEDLRARVLPALAPYLSEPLHREVLEITRAIADEDLRAEILAALAPHLPESMLHEALEVTQAIAYYDSQARVLGALALHLPESLMHEALEVTRAITDEYYRAETLVKLAPHLPESLQTTTLLEALEAARAIADEDLRAETMVKLAYHLPESLQTTTLLEALEAARAIADEDLRAETLAALAPYLPEPMLHEALKVTRAIAYENHRAQVLAALAPYLPRSLLHEALDIARAIADEHYRAQVLTALAPHLPESLLDETLEVTRAVTYEYPRAQVLVALAPYLPESLQATTLLEALEITRAIIYEGLRAEILVKLAPHLPESLLHEVLEVTRTITDEYHRIETLVKLVPYLPESLQTTTLLEALEAARAIADENLRAEVLAALVPQLPEPLLHEVLVVTRTITNEYIQAKVLVPLASHLPKSLLEVTRAIADEYPRAQVLVALAPHLPESLLHEALEVAQTITDKDYRAQVLVALAPHFPESLLHEALEVTQTITDKDYRAQVLAALAPHLSEPMLHKALEVTRAIAYEEHQAEALVKLAPHLSEPMLHEALEVTRDIAYENLRAETLIKLAPHLPESLLHEALEVTQTITDKYPRAQALTTLAPHLPESLQTTTLLEALETAQAIAYEDHRARMLATLVPHLPESLQTTTLLEALEAARASAHEDLQTEVIVALAPHLPESLQATTLLETLDATRASANKDLWTEVLTTLILRMKQLPGVRLYTLWNKTLHILATNSRPSLLSDIQVLVPIIAALGGKDALVATAQSIIEEGKWFP